MSFTFRPDDDHTKIYDDNNYIGYVMNADNLLFGIDKEGYAQEIAYAQNITEIKTLLKDWLAKNNPSVSSKIEKTGLKADVERLMNFMQPELEKFGGLHPMKKVIDRLKIELEKHP